VLASAGIVAEVSTVDRRSSSDDGEVIAAVCGGGSDVGGVSSSEGCFFPDLADDDGPDVGISTEETDWVAVVAGGTTTFESNCFCRLECFLYAL
jgi:hypothetical protein